ncbi:hypothetical protein TTRE_0000950001 [Trichuris trichiura]|uniref:Uncharacterized protein n=1 Tax=Trichuris trichiura TaxID=36087 RepID=A0A077ZL79_TRITR|nr:hypothetical protein TTRE_0000950001 [Trichuris trichiura]
MSTKQFSSRITNVVHSSRSWRHPRFGPAKDTIPSLASRVVRIAWKERYCYGEGYDDARVIVHLGVVVRPGSVTVEPRMLTIFLCRPPPKLTKFWQVGCQYVNKRKVNLDTSTINVCGKLTALPVTWYMNALRTCTL